MNNTNKSDKYNAPDFHSIAIPVIGKFEPAFENDCSEYPDHLFVGRQAIIKNLIDILMSDRKRGSYLIAGYRGAGKTSVVKKALIKYPGKKRILKVHINLGETSHLTPIKHPAASSEVLNTLFKLLVFNQLTPRGARN